MKQRAIVFSGIFLIAALSAFFTLNSQLSNLWAAAGVLTVALSFSYLIKPSFITIVGRVGIPLSYAILVVSLYSFINEHHGDMSFFAPKSMHEIENKFYFEPENNFFSAINVLFSICAAFLLWKGLSDFDNLKQTLNAEAEKIWAIVYLTTYLRDEENNTENKNNIDVTDRICYFFQNYINSAIGKQFENYEIKPDMSRLSSSDTLIDDCVSETKNITVKENDDNDRIALEEIMKDLSELVAIRSKRRVCMDTQMPPYVLGIIVFMSLTLMLPFIGLAGASFGIYHLYLFILAFVYMFICMTLVDLSSPFAGYFKIQLNAFEEVGQRIDTLISERRTSGDRDKLPSGL